MIFLKIKTIILIIIAFIILILTYNKKENIIIPKESIRIRIISNSNNDVDVKEKKKVKKSVEKELYSILKNAKSIDEAKDLINNNLDNILDLLKSNPHFRKLFFDNMSFVISKNKYSFELNYIRDESFYIYLLSCPEFIEGFNNI